jgi:hypothetical protein
MALLAESDAGEGLQPLGSSRNIGRESGSLKAAYRQRIPSAEADTGRASCSGSTAKGAIWGGIGIRSGPQKSGRNLAAEIILASKAGEGLKAQAKVKPRRREECMAGGSYEGRSGV